MPLNRVLEQPFSPLADHGVAWEARIFIGLPDYGLRAA